ncbi:MAG: hypothetical protein HC896_00045 [Bacteroidales bacterium]|nr:hypothetical protein [Bacteroidales bacterium]
MAAIEINGKEYSWGNIDVIMGGRPVLSLRKISYKASQEKEPLYGRGNDPIGTQKGNKKYGGDLGVGQSELEALARAAGEGASILDLPPFDINVAYIADEGLPIIVDQIKNVEFTDIEKSMKQGDKSMDPRCLLLQLKSYMECNRVAGFGSRPQN